MTWKLEVHRQKVLGVEKLCPKARADNPPLRTLVTTGLRFRVLDLFEAKNSNGFGGIVAKDTSAIANLLVEESVCHCRVKGSELRVRNKGMEKTSRNAVVLRSPCNVCGQGGCQYQGPLWEPIM